VVAQVPFTLMRTYLTAGRHEQHSTTSASA
jgi:hypothetical protein